MVETNCPLCKRDVSKHDPLALRVCFLKAIRELSRLSRKSARKPSVITKKQKEVNQKK